MPAYPTHTLFSHLALLALVDAKHPLAPIAHRHQALFRIAGIAGCDIQCMPYQVCAHCHAPYRHNQRDNRKCLVCAESALEDFSVPISDGRRVHRVEIERDLYRNTHLVLGRRPRPYGVDPNAPPGPAEQPFPGQVVRHLANMLRDAKKIAGPADQVSRYFAFTLGWFSHVVSDAIFKGVYRHSVQVNWIGHQYHMAMLPAAEAVTMTDISYDFGVHWPSWHQELLQDQPDGGALRHLSMGNPPHRYDPNYWTPEFGPPDESIGRILDALPPVNRTWFHRMYLVPDYSAPTPLLDQRQMDARGEWLFHGKNLGELRAYAIGTGWYNAFVKGLDIYLRIVDEAMRLAQIPPSELPGAPAARTPAGVIGWGLWREIIQAATNNLSVPADWGSKLEIDPDAIAVLEKPSVGPASIILPEPATDYQRALGETIRSAWHFRGTDAPLRIVIGPPAFNSAAMPALCREDLLRLKYEKGLAGLIAFDPENNSIHVAGLSDFGDHQLLQWMKRQIGKSSFQLEDTRKNLP